MFYVDVMITSAHYFRRTPLFPLLYGFLYGLLILAGNVAEEGFLGAGRNSLALGRLTPPPEVAELPEELGGDSNNGPGTVDTPCC